MFLRPCTAPGLIAVRTTSSNTAHIVPFSVSASAGELGELEPVVLSGSLLRVDGCRGDELGVAVAGELHVPALPVDLLVVVLAEQGAVVEVGGSAVVPFPLVVAVAVGGCLLAAGGDAALVADHEGAAGGLGEAAAGAAVVEDFGGAAEHERGDPGVTGEAAELARGQGAAAVEHPGAGDRVTQRVEGWW